jgi:hypothetical protein
MSSQAIRAAVVGAAAIACGLVAMASPGDATPESAPLHLRIKIIGSNPVTEITVGGKEIQATVDTGGGAIALSEEAIRSAGGVKLKEDREWSDALGRKYRVPQFSVPLLGIGGQTFQNVIVILAAEKEGPPVPNAIGGQFLSQYLAIVDYAGLSIILWPKSAKERAVAACGEDSIPMEKTEQPDLAVSLFKTPSGPLKLLWDTGATYSMLPNTFASSRNLATARRGETPFYGPVELSAGSRIFAPLEFVVLPLELPRDFDGMLGKNFFMEHVVCLDFQRREVRVR